MCRPVGDHMVMSPLLCISHEEIDRFIEISGKVYWKYWPSQGGHGCPLFFSRHAALCKSYRERLHHQLLPLHFKLATTTTAVGRYQFTALHIKLPGGIQLPFVMAVATQGIAPVLFLEGGPAKSYDIGHGWGVVPVDGSEGIILTATTVKDYSRN